MYNFQDKIVLVTGGSRGIGREISKLFGRSGATVVINYYQDKSAADSLMLEMASMGGHAVLSQCDIGDRDSVEEMVQSIFDLYGRIDILVNNAGIWEPTPAGATDPKVFERTMAVNLDGVIYCAEAVVPGMKERRSGVIINISSTAGQRGEAGFGVYAATKGGVISYTKSLAAELASSGIRVNCVAPGWVVSDMTENTFEEQGDQIFPQIPLQRAGRPEEIAWPVLFLASEQASYITGEILNVNGGSVLCG